MKSDQKAVWLFTWKHIDISQAKNIQKIVKRKMENVFWSDGDGDTGSLLDILST